MKKMVSLLLACGLICSTLFAVTGCSDSKSGKKSSGDTSSKYYEIFDQINNCDVESAGSSMKILQTDFYVKNWLKDNADAIKEGSTVSSSDADSELSKYISHMKDDEKAEFGVKCQAVVDADLKLLPIFYSDRAKAWGADVKEYNDTEVGICNMFFETLQDALSTEGIKPSADYPYITPTEEMENNEAFDETTFLDLIYSMSGLESGSAGSTYQLNLDTADFMQFVIDNAKFSESDMKTGIENCYSLLGPSEKLTFDWNFIDVIENIDELKDNPTLITDMGISVAVDKFAKTDLDKLVKVMSEVSGVSYTK